MSTLGKFSEILLEGEFEWKIENFTSIPEEENKYYFSPKFSFAGATWNFCIYPNGHKDTDSIGYIDLYLCKISSNEPSSLDFSLLIKTVDEKTGWVDHSSIVFKGDNASFGSLKIFKRSKLFKKSELMPSNSPNNILTIVCILKHMESGNTNNVQAAECSYCKKVSDAEIISSHEIRCLDKPIKCPECNDIIKLRSWYEHVCPMDKEKVIGKMLHYFKDIMVTGEHSDTIIQVREVEFRLHRNILAARNPFFSAMFKSDMREKDTGFVSIDDCEPDIFRQFVCFLYTGKVEAMSQENVRRLYEIADKYQDEQLKVICLNFMMNAISVDNFCEFIALPLKFDEKKLFEKAIEFFVSRADEIVRHVKWQNFLKEYPTQANELFIKFLDNYKK